MNSIESLLNKDTKPVQSASKPEFKSEIQNYRALYEEYHELKNKSQQLFQQEQKLRQILIEYHDRNEALMDMLQELEDQNEFATDAAKEEEKLRKIVEARPELQNILETDDLMLKSHLLGLYDGIPLWYRNTFAQSSLSAEVPETDPNDTSVWLRNNYGKIFKETGDILNTLKPLPNTSAYYLLNSMIDSEEVTGMAGVPSSAPVAAPTSASSAAHVAPVAPAVSAVSTAPVPDITPVPSVIASAAPVAPEASGISDHDSHPKMKKLKDLID